MSCKTSYLNNTWYITSSLSIAETLTWWQFVVTFVCFNHIWLTQDFPTSWKTAIIIPVPKLGKMISDPGCYRYIALTSCLCKTMERMVNCLWTWYIERHMVITEFQSEFRRHRSTADNLLKLERSIIDAFVGKKHLSSIFFYLEKAYDTIWKTWYFIRSVVYQCLSVIF